MQNLNSVEMWLLGLPLLIVLADCAQLPANWPRCKNDSSIDNCLKGAIQFAMKDLMNGNRTLGIIPLDPLKVKYFESVENSGPVAIRFVATDVTLLGNNRAKVSNVRNDWKTMDLSWTAPRMQIAGKYSVDGNILFLPINGKGKFKFILDDYSANLKFHFERYIKKGKEYIKVKDAFLTPDAKNLKMRIDNLFNGNKNLGDRMNNVLNSNWRLLFDTVQPRIGRPMGDVMKLISNSIFSRVPADNFIIR